jgi:hypothetical protein
VLSRNEVDRDYAYNRRLFRRIAQGWYQIDPTLAVRRHTVEGEVWVPIVEALNLRLVKELAAPIWWETLDEALAAGGAPPAGVPIALEEKVRQWEAERARERARLERAPASRPTLRPWAEKLALEPPVPSAPEEERPAPWGTPEARRQALKRLKRELSEQEWRKKGKGGA